MTRNLFKIIVALTAAVALLLLAAVFFVFHQSGPLAALPTPNGYDNFVKAGQALAGNFYDWPKMEADQLRPLLQTNAEALTLLRTGLGRECAVVPDFNEQLTNHFTALSTFKGLAQLLAAEGRLAELEKRTNAAARCYTESIRFGIKSAQHGVMIDVLVGLACENKGAMALEKLLPQLDAATSRELAHLLEANLETCDSAETVLQSEKGWALRTYGVRGVVSAILNHPQLRKNRLAFISKYNVQQSRTQQILLNLASHAYEMETGHRPTSPSDLVPLYLKAIPAKSAAFPLPKS
jgi:hypothetical protein